MPNYGAYIKSGKGGEVVFSTLLRIDDGVLIGLIINRLQCSKEQAQALIATYIAEQRGERTPPQPPKSETEPPKVEPLPVEQRAEPFERRVAVTPSVAPYQRENINRYSERQQFAKRRKKVDPLIVVVIVAIVCVIGLLITAYIRNGGRSIGL